MSEKNKKRKKNSRRLFSLDSLMGKVLCVLLVVILTVGAFLAPKLINNLYDTGTLMQITYVDMDLSTYAVPYTVFQDKIEAVARAQSAGSRLAVLPAEETADRISDEELIRIVNEEMETVGDNMSVLFKEGWWDAQTVDNLVSREKHTVYMSLPAVQEDASQEMTPFQVWTLTFALAEKQDELVVYNGKDRKTLSQFATDRLIVCMDADFYKIIAVAVRGDRLRTEKMYGWDMIYLFGAAPDAPASVRREAASYDYTYLREAQMGITSEISERWVEYWDIKSKNYIYQIDDAGTLSAYLILEDKTSGTQDKSSGGEETSGAAVAADMEAAGYPDEDIPAPGAGELLLEAGCRVEWEATDDNIWILKAGCMEFFEMMQF